MPPPAPIAERLAAKLARVGDCLVFTGSTDRWGYGQLWSGAPYNKPLAAHRVALRLSGVAVPDGRLVLHSCDNPACCEPAHLRVGDHAENMRDRSARRRVAHKLSPEQVRDLRSQAGTCSWAELGARFGVTGGHASKLARGIKQPGA